MMLYNCQIRYNCFSMGHTSSHINQVDPNFPMQNYMNQGLNRQQILVIRSVFESYRPRNGYIDCQRYRQTLLQSDLKDLAVTKLANKDSLDFDDFFAIEKEVVLLQIKKNPGIEVDSTQVEPPSNILCPYAQEVVRN